MQAVLFRCLLSVPEECDEPNEMRQCDRRVERRCIPGRGSAATSVMSAIVPIEENDRSSDIMKRFTDFA